MKDPKLHAGLDNQIDTEYELLHYIGTMKTPFIAVMDGITSKVIRRCYYWERVNN